VRRGKANKQAIPGAKKVDAVNAVTVRRLAAGIVRAGGWQVIMASADAKQTRLAGGVGSPPPPSGRRQPAARAPGSEAGIPGKIRYQE
jgi:hypothetical protein